jgi:hypothetical protein
MEIWDIHIHDGQLVLTSDQVSVLVAFCVAFAAFCIWLTVRIVNRRERWAKWTLAATLCAAALIAAGISILDRMGKAFAAMD